MQNDRERRPGDDAPERDRSQETGEDPKRRFGNAVDDAATDSFPASDPPSTTPLTGESFPSDEAIQRAQERERRDAEHARG